MEQKQKLIELMAAQLGEDHPSVEWAKAALQQLEPSGEPAVAPAAGTSAHDGYHWPVCEGRPHPYWYCEWWYLNFIDPASGRSGIIVITVIDPKDVALSAIAGLGVMIYEQGARPIVIADAYRYREFSASEERADVALGSNRIRAKSDDHYHVQVATKNGRVKLDLRYDQADQPEYLSAETTVPGSWEYFNWLVWMPKARVSGAITIDGEAYRLTDAVGYHDHNWGSWKRMSRMWSWAQAASDDLDFVVVPDVPFVGTRGTLRMGDQRLYFDQGVGTFDVDEWEHWEHFWKYPVKARYESTDTSGRYRLELSWTVDDTATLWKSAMSIFEQLTTFKGTLYEKAADGTWKTVKTFELQGFSEWTDAWI